MTTSDQATKCRYCARVIFQDTLNHDGAWNLVYRVYEDTLNCDARGDGSVLSDLPHEPTTTPGRVTMTRGGRAIHVYVVIPAGWLSAEIRRDQLNEGGHVVNTITDRSGRVADADDMLVDTVRELHQLGWIAT